MNSGINQINSYRFIVGNHTFSSPGKIFNSRSLPSASEGLQNCKSCKNEVIYVGPSHNQGGLKWVVLGKQDVEVEFADIWVEEAGVNHLLVDLQLAIFNIALRTLRRGGCLGRSRACPACTPWAGCAGAAVPCRCAWASACPGSSAKPFLLVNVYILPNQC